jgi:hypothetical protein
MILTISRETSKNSTSFLQNTIEIYIFKYLKIYVALISVTEFESFVSHFLIHFFLLMAAYTV